MTTIDLEKYRLYDRNASKDDIINELFITTPYDRSEIEYMVDKAEIMFQDVNFKFYSLMLLCASLCWVAQKYAVSLQCTADNIYYYSKQFTQN